jgi:hypothetical protein
VRVPQAQCSETPPLTPPRKGEKDLHPRFPIYRNKFDYGRKSVFNSPILSRERGVSRTSRTLGRDAVDAVCQARASVQMYDAFAYDEAVWS